MAMKASRAGGLPRRRPGVPGPHRAGEIVDERDLHAVLLVELGAVLHGSWPNCRSPVSPSSSVLAASALLSLADLVVGLAEVDQDGAGDRHEQGEQAQRPPDVAVAGQPEAVLHRLRERSRRPSAGPAVNSAASELSTTVIVARRRVRGRLLAQDRPGSTRGAPRSATRDPAGARRRRPWPSPPRHRALRTRVATTDPFASGFAAASGSVRRWGRTARPGRRRRARPGRPAAGWPPRRTTPTRRRRRSGRAPRAAAARRR